MVCTYRNNKSNSLSPHILTDMEVSIQETVDVDLGLKTNKKTFGHFEDFEVLRKCGLYRIAVNLKESHFQC